MDSGGRNSFVSVLRRITLTAVQELMEEVEEHDEARNVRLKYEEAKEKIAELETMVKTKDKKVEMLKKENGSLKEEVERLKKARIF